MTAEADAGRRWQRDDDYLRLRHVVVEVLLDAEAGGDVVAIRRAVGDEIDAIEGGVPTPDVASLYRAAVADHAAEMERAEGLVRVVGRLEEALRAHLMTHNGAPGDPEPLCACAACVAGRAALAGGTPPDTSQTDSGGGGFPASSGTAASLTADAETIREALVFYGADPVNAGRPAEEALAALDRLAAGVSGGTTKTAKPSCIGRETWDALVAENSAEVAAATYQVGWAALDDEMKAEWTQMVAEMREPTAAACTCGYPKRECLLVVLQNGPPFPPRPCEPTR